MESITIWSGDEFTVDYARECGIPIIRDLAGWYVDARELEGWSKHYDTEREALWAALGVMERLWTESDWGKN